jgi:hypothetical protein
MASPCAIGLCGKVIICSELASEDVTLLAFNVRRPIGSTLGPQRARLLGWHDDLHSDQICWNPNIHPDNFAYISSAGPNQGRITSLLNGNWRHLLKDKVDNCESSG